VVEETTVSSDGDSTLVTDSRPAPPGLCAGVADQPGLDHGGGRLSQAGCSEWLNNELGSVGVTDEPSGVMTGAKQVHRV
jgi:hypothetical protein